MAGRYSIDDEIGAGAMATVYLARDLRHNRKVASKSAMGGVALSVSTASRNAQYDLFPDGKRFVMIRDRSGEPGADNAARLIVLVNWKDELKRRAPSR